MFTRPQTILPIMLRVPGNQQGKTKDLRVKGQTLDN